MRAVPFFARALAVISMIVPIGSCATETTGVLRATRIGAVSDVPLARSAPDAALAASCGDGALTDAGAATIRRDAYLEDTSARGTRVMWTATIASPLTLRVTTPEGEAVARVASTLEPTRYLRNAHQHVARVEGLEPATVYCYAIEAADGTVLRRAGGFATPPAPGEGDAVRFVAFGDSGVASTDQLTLFAQMQEVPFELALAVGDIAYEEGTVGQLEDGYFGVYAPLLGSIPFFPISGNHEYRTDGAAPFREVFALPENGGPNGLERWYSFDHGPVHFVALDTEQIGATQAAWLETDLAATTSPWIVVFAHRPAYSSGGHGSSVPFRQTFAPILERHGVALVISGHDHHYERFAPQNGVTYVVTGGGGKSTREPGALLPESAFAEAVTSFVHVSIDGDALTLRAIDATGQEFDGAVISRPSVRAR